MRFGFLLLLLFFSFSCARRGNPSGGPKDENAPILIRTIPEFKSVNFKAKEIKIYFDEYIKLKDINKHLVISPPLKYAPIIKPLGLPSKKITIKIQDTLLENTTYTFNFGESIIDNSEGNILSNFKYIFSTGNYIDSLSLKGSVQNTFHKKAEKYVSVLLYPADTTFRDSTIYLKKPRYIASTLDSIHWEITNIKKGTYHLIALKEENSDYLFNPKTDKIGFLDTIIKIPTDKEPQIKLFKEILPFKANKPIEVSKGYLIFGFEGDAKKFKVAIDSNEIVDKTFKSISFFEKEKDTLNYFFKSGKIVDSLKFNLTNTYFTSKEKIILRSSKIDTLKISSNVRGVLNFRDTLKIITNNPYIEFNKKLMELFDKDSTAVAYTLQRKNNTNLIINFDKKENQRYRLNLYPGAIIDFFMQKNDTLKYAFSTKKITDYGNITLRITNVKDPIIVQLLTDKFNLIEEKFTHKNTTLEFISLTPAKYNIRIIIDKNNNRKWDTGNYLKKIQPEKVLYFEKEINVKSNWFVKESMNLQY